jgi:polysaccharide pyruvyl transferase WcaK-like protein
VGLFGNLGSGNLGNDGSLDALVAFIRDRHPDAELDFLCAGPAQVAARYQVRATALKWYDAHRGTATGARAVLLRAAGKVLDAVRTLAWVRRQDVVIVPGMGVLEATVPLRPWGFPFALFWLCVCARLVGTKVALVSVGADVIGKRILRWMITRAARLAHYRSYRDGLSRDALRAMGVDVHADEVYPDLAFALAAPATNGVATGTVAVGVMAYYGGNDDDGRTREALHRAYLKTITRFVRWLIDGGRRVRLVTGDRVDEGVVRAILADLATQRPGLDPSQVIAEAATTQHELMRQLAGADAVVATRYHNVLCALKLGKPTLSIGYAAKNDVLMAGMGVGEFCQGAGTVDFDLLVEQFTTLERRSEQVRRTLAEHNRAATLRLEQQFDALSAVLFPAEEPTAAGDTR